MIEILAGKQIFETVVKILVTLAIAAILIGILPASPFPAIIEVIAEFPYIGYLNWFFPVGKCLAALTAWATCMGVWYGISWIFRQLNIISAA